MDLETKKYHFKNCVLLLPGGVAVHNFKSITIPPSTVCLPILPPKPITWYYIRCQMVPISRIDCNVSCKEKVRRLRVLDRYSSKQVQKRRAELKRRLRRLNKCCSPK